MRVVTSNLAPMRYAYNERLRNSYALKGKITVRFAIDEFGKVIFCKVDSTTMRDTLFEATIVKQIYGWQFERIPKPGDITEVIYPFVFSNGNYGPFKPWHLVFATPMLIIAIVTIVVVAAKF
jgi:hypothetical protein